MHRTLAVMRKEFIHIFRDHRTLAVMFLIPIIQLVLLGYAATTDVDHISTAVFDQDRTAQSRGLIYTYGTSGYFDINYYVASEEALARLIDGGKARAGLLIPAGYSRDLAREGTAQVSVVPWSSN